MNSTIDRPNQIQNEKLVQLIRQDITKSNGHISFAHFMQLALYTPEIGYYSGNSLKFGKKGDFVTAPEISTLFAKSVAQQCYPVLQELGWGDILEIGAGSGVFAKDLLLELEKLAFLPRYYFIYELSPTLRARQKELLTSICPHLLERIVWLDSLPSQFTGIIFANEVMDAMPIHRFAIHEGNIKEQNVGWKDHSFCWHLTDPSPELFEKVQLLQQECQLPSSYQSEVSLILPQWIQALADTLKKGIILLFDYGYGRNEYYHHERTDGTLKCFYQHHHHNNPLINVGLQDITAHVDFTTLVEAAVNSGLSLGGYTTQASFLLACGILELAKSSSDLESYQLSQEIKMLTLPSQMGELVKVMGLTKDFDHKLVGFSLHDRRRDL